jgi:hypothetical protein
MKDSTDNTLNGGGIVPEYKDGSFGWIIHTIRRSILLPKCTDTIVHLVRLGPQVCFAPSNCFAYDGPNLMNTKI